MTVQKQILFGSAFGKVLATFIVACAITPQVRGQSAFTPPATGGSGQGVSNSATTNDCLFLIEGGVQTVDSCLSPISTTAVIAETRKIDRKCPWPTREDNGGKCVLDNDVVLDVPLELDSSTHLNCRGHHLMPQAAGLDGDVGGYRPSIPEVAIALIATRDTKIQNCVIGSPDRRFDFAVVIVASKAPETDSSRHKKSPTRLDGNKVLNNEMHVRNAGVTLLAADDNQISENLITWDGSGIGINVDRDSDRNQIMDNTLRSSARPPTYVRKHPGTDSGAIGNTDVGVVQADSVNAPLINVIIGDRLVQVTNIGGPRVEDNIVKNNSVFLPGPHTGKNHGGILAAVMSSRSVIRGNTVVGGRPGIRNAGFPANTAFTIPAQCSVDPTRYCLTSADCKIAGIDAVSRGSCPMLGPPVITDGRVHGVITEGNLLIGPFDEPGGADVADAAISVAANSVDAVVQNNHIWAADSSFGITVSNVTTTMVTRNVIDGGKVGLNLRSGVATSFGALISLNDVINSSASAVATTGVYTLPTELSVGGVGNYWGHGTAPGFRPADTNNPLVADHNPFCEQVAASIGQLPAICP